MKVSPGPEAPGYEWYPEESVMVVGRVESGNAFAFYSRGRENILP